MLVALACSRGLSPCLSTLRRGAVSLQVSRSASLSSSSSSLQNVLGSRPIVQQRRFASLLSSPASVLRGQRFNDAASDDRAHTWQSPSSSSFVLAALVSAGFVLLASSGDAKIFARAAEPEAEAEAGGSESDAGDQQAQPASSDEQQQQRPTGKRAPKMKNYKYVIVGCGQAGYNALRAIRHLDPTASVLVVSQETQMPYDRPPLSKHLWGSDDPSKLEFKEWATGPTESVFFAKETDFEAPVTFLRGATVYGLKTNKKFLVLDKPNDETEMVIYEKLLIATGAEPRLIDNIDPAVLDRVSTFRDLEDFEYLYELTGQPVHVTVVGGGVLGTELASSLSKRPGVRVTQVVASDGLLGKVLPPALAEEATQRARAAGIEVVCGERVVALAPSTDSAEQRGVKIELASGASLDSEHVVLAIGTKPRTSLAKEGQLECDANGALLVNAELQASVSDVFGAGDAVSYWDQNLRRRRYIGHIDHATLSGQTAGLNMVGKDGKKFTQDLEPIWWTALPGGIEIVGVGITDSSLETYAVFLEAPQGEENKLGTGVVYYLSPVSPRSKRVVGVMLWNHPTRMESARKLITTPTYVKDNADCIDKIPLYPPAEVAQPADNDEDDEDNTSQQA